MSKYYVTPTTAIHVAQLLTDVRPEDKRELWGAMHWTPYNALVHSVRQTDTGVYSGMVDDAVLCIFGISRKTLISSVGVPWMVATNALPVHTLAWARRNRKVFAAVTAGWPSLENYVDARYTKAVRWVKWLGFTVEEARPFGPDGVLFHRFTMER